MHHSMVFDNNTGCLFSEEVIEKRLEKNIERIGIENYYLLETVCKDHRGPVPLIIVYCYDGFYSLYDTELKYEKIGGKRYFLIIRLMIVSRNFRLR